MVLGEIKIICSAVVSCLTCLQLKYGMQTLLIWLQIYNFVV